GEILRRVNLHIVHGSDDVPCSNTSIEGWRAANDSPDDDAVIVPVVDNHAQSFQRIVKRRLKFLDENRRLHIDNLLAAIAEDDDFDAAQRTSSVEILNKVSFPCDAVTVDRKDGVARIEAHIGDSSSCGDIGYYEAVGGGVEPQPHVGGAEVVDVEVS